MKIYSVHVQLDRFCWDHLRAKFVKDPHDELEIIIQNARPLFHVKGIPSSTDKAELKLSLTSQGLLKWSSK